MIPRFGMIVLSVLPLLALTCILIAAAHAIIVAITPPRRGVKVPSCEKCRYPVAGLAALACPECGADLRATGIITRPMEMRRRGSLMGAITWLTVLCLVLMLCCSYLAVMVTGVWGMTPTTSTTTTAITPASSRYKSIQFEQTTGSPGPMVAVVATLKLNDGTTHRLEVSSGGASAVLKDASDIEFARGKFDDTITEQLFTHAGIPITDPTVAVELADLTRIIDHTLASPWNPPTSIRTKKLTVGAPALASTPPVPTAMNAELAQLLAFAVPLLLWVFGVIAIIYRRKKLLREAESTDPPIALPAPTPPVPTPL